MQEVFVGEAKKQWRCCISYLSQAVQHTEWKPTFETLWFSRLIRISINVADLSLLHLLFLRSLSILSGYPIINIFGCHQDTKLWIGHMAHHKHILGFITPNILPICLMIMAALAMCQALMWLGVGVGKFLIVLGARNIFDTKITWSGSMLVSDWLAVCFIELLKLIEWKIRMEWHIKASFVS